MRAEEEACGRPRTPIVALTANALKGEADRCLDAGMDDYVTKPLTLERLREAVARWVTDEGQPAIDRSVVEAMFGGNSQAVRRVLDRFRDAGARLVEQIAGARQDPKKLVELAHKLKGAARSAGAMALGDLAAALEKSGRAADSTPCSSNGGASTPSSAPPDGETVEATAGDQQQAEGEGHEGHAARQEQADRPLARRRFRAPASRRRQRW